MGVDLDGEPFERGSVGGCEESSTFHHTSYAITGGRDTCKVSLLAVTYSHAIIASIPIPQPAKHVEYLP